MRAVHVVTRLNVGGIARFLEIGRGAVDVLVRGRVEPGETDAHWQGPQVRMPGLRRALRPLDDTRALAGLVRGLRRLRPGVVHTHASKAGALGRVAARILNVPSVHTFHGHVLQDYFSGPVSWGLTRVERILARGTGLTATGPATAADLSARLDAPVEVIPPGIAMPPAAAGAREQLRASFGNPERVALAVGRPAAVKDLQRFVRAARAAGYLPVVAGASHVEGALALGHVARMQDVYAACDVVVSTSHREGTPFALLEAAWCGRPVVATAVGDVAWVVGGGGLLIEDTHHADDPDKIATALVRLHDPALRAELGRRAATDVRERFPAGALSHRLRSLYATLRLEAGI